MRLQVGYYSPNKRGVLILAATAVVGGMGVYALSVYDFISFARLAGDTTDVDVATAVLMDALALGGETAACPDDHVE